MLLLFIAEQAQLRCAIVGLAMERYRLAHGRWPKKLAELIPEQLPLLPSNPFDGSPLSLERLPDGFLINAVRPANKDGYSDSRGFFTSGKGKAAFRLWDVSARRQHPWNPVVGPPREYKE